MHEVQLEISWVLTVPLNFMPSAEGIAIDWLKCWLTGPGLLHSLIAITMISTAYVPEKEVFICPFIERKKNCAFPQQSEIYMDF